MNKIIRIFVLLCIVSLIHITNAHADRHQLHLQGKIDEHFLSQLEQIDGVSADVHVNLSGGKVAIALDAAELAQKNDWHLYVSALCISACAEILVLGFPEVTIKRGGLIGFHGNSAMKNHMYKLASGDERSTCFQQHESRRIALYQQAGANYEFWRQQYARLKPGSIRIGRTTESGCHILHYDLTYDVWFPSSLQLAQDYGLRFNGIQSIDDQRYLDIFKTMLEPYLGNVILADGPSD